MIIKENAAFKSSKEKSASIHQRREREKKKSNFKNRLLVKRKKFISDFTFTFTTIFFHNFSYI